ncbi:MAG: hypothetical protein E4H07_04980 [Nitrosomonadales bacterium]|nr:MAG: hypothetical protein E4H07_04980 [Nitrosomonadales bacterium]
MKTIEEIIAGLKILNNYDAFVSLEHGIIFVSLNIKPSEEEVRMLLRIHWKYEDKFYTEWFKYV